MAKPQDKRGKIDIEYPEPGTRQGGGDSPGQQQQDNQNPGQTGTPGGKGKQDAPQNQNR